MSFYTETWITRITEPNQVDTHGNGVHRNPSVWDFDMDGNSYWGLLGAASSFRSLELQKANWIEEQSTYWRFTFDASGRLLRSPDSLYRTYGWTEKWEIGTQNNELAVLGNVTRSEGRWYILTFTERSRRFHCSCGRSLHLAQVLDDVGRARLSTINVDAQNHSRWFRSSFHVALAALLRYTIFCSGSGRYSSTTNRSVRSGRMILYVRSVCDCISLFGYFLVFLYLISSPYTVSTSLVLSEKTSKEPGWSHRVI